MATVNYLKLKDYGFQYGDLIPLDKVALIEPVNPKTPREWQKECYDQFITSDKKHFLINAPTAAGKTFLSKMLGAAFLKGDKAKRLIISVPMRNIGNGFRVTEQISVDGLSFNWFVHTSNYLCEGQNNDSGKQEQLKKFLTYPAITGQDRIIVVTHQTLGRFFMSLTEEDKALYLRDIALFFDEAHHSQSEEGEENNCGGVIGYFFNNEDRNLSVTLSTATFFRGDGMDIVPVKSQEVLDTYKMPYDKYFESTRYVKGFTQHTHIQNNGHWHKPLSALFKEKIGKTIVFVPPTGMLNTTVAHKSGTVKKVLDAIGKNAVKTSYGYDIKKQGKTIRVVDLVTEATQDAGGKYALKHPEKVDVIIAMKMFQEGSDWVEANRCIIIGARNSLTQIMQCVGRILRDHNSKHGVPVETHLIIPNVLMKKQDVGDRVNDLTKAFFLSMIMEDALMPKIKQRKGTKVSDWVGEDDTFSVSLSSKFKNEDEEMEALDRAVKAIAAVEDNGKGLSRKEKTEKCIEAVAEVLKEMGIEAPDTVAKLIVKRFEEKSSRMIPSLGTDPASIKIKLAIESSPILGCLLAYTTSCGVDSIREFRSIADSNTTYEAIITEIKTFIVIHGNPPTRSESSSEERALDQWCARQRYSFRNGRLTAYKISLCESIPGWYWTLDMVFTNMIADIKDFVKLHNRLPYGTTQNKAEKVLGRWIEHRRSDYRRNEVRLTKTRKALCESIPGWYWNLDKQFTQCVDAVRQFAIVNKRLPTHGSRDKHEKRLGQWASHRRRDYINKQDRLTKERIALCESIPGWYWREDAKQAA